MIIYLYLVIGLFALMLLVSVFFRIRVIKKYKLLRDKGIQFNSSHFFNIRKMENEIYPKYPELKSEIASFVKEIKLSVTFSTILLILIFTFAWLLKRSL